MARRQHPEDRGHSEERGHPAHGGHSEVDRRLKASDLPEGLQKRITEVIEGRDLTRAAMIDVTRELVAHFEDGLAAGRSAEELLEDFGDERRASTLIARAKHRVADAERQAERSSKRGDSLATRLVGDLRYAFRRLAQSPGFTATAVLSLALGIGANAAIFTLVNEVLLRELPYEDPDQLVEIYISEPEFSYNIFSYPDFVDMQEATRDVFASVSGTGFAFVSMDAEAGIELLTAEMVTGEYFSLLGLEAHLGRTLTPDDDVSPGAHAVVVLGNGYWQRTFGADPGVIGTQIRLNGLAYTIVGVVPESFTGSLRGLVPDLFVPIMMANQLQPASRDRLAMRSAHWAFAKGRLKAGASQEQARVTLAGLAERLKDDYPGDWKADDRFLVISSQDVVMFPPIDRYLLPAAGFFMGVVGLVLLVACANLASFLLARAMDRQKEVAIRLALGATRGSLIRQLLTETAVLAVLGGAAGVLLSVWLLKALLSADLPMPIPITLDLSPDLTVMGFSLAISLASGMLFGLAPALQATRGDLVSALKEGGAGGTRRGRVTLRNSLVVAQVALSLVLLVAAGLFLRSLQATQAVDPGFGREPAGVLSIVAPDAKYGEEGSRAFVRTLLERFEQLPGVDGVGIIDNLHLSQLNTQWMDINVDGVEPPPGRDSHAVDKAIVGSGFFEAAGVRILQGRNFNDSDTPETEGVAIVSETLANRFFPGEEAIGRVLHPTDAEDIRIIGVASDAKVRTLAEANRPFIYQAYSQRYTADVTVVARTSTDPQVTALTMLRVARELDPELMVFETKTIQRHIDTLLLPARLGAVVVAGFAGLALVLASIGLYGLVSYAVAQRTREVGIRMSLGADGGTVVRMLMGGGLKLVAWGTGIGLGLALLLSQALSQLLFGTSPRDVITFAAVPLVLAAVALLAAWVPARRASRVDPVTALRSE